MQKFYGFRYFLLPCKTQPKLLSLQCGWFFDGDTFKWLSKISRWEVIRLGRLDAS